MDMRYEQCATCQCGHWLFDASTNRDWNEQYKFDSLNVSKCWTGNATRRRNKIICFPVFRILYSANMNDLPKKETILIKQTNKQGLNEALHVIQVPCQSSQEDKKTCSEHILKSESLSEFNVFRTSFGCYNEHSNIIINVCVCVCVLRTLLVGELTLNSAVYERAFLSSTRSMSE